MATAVRVHPLNGGRLTHWNFANCVTQSLPTGLVASNPASSDARDTVMHSCKNQESCCEVNYARSAHDITYNSIVPFVADTFLFFNALFRMTSHGFTPVTSSRRPLNSLRFLPGRFFPHGCCLAKNWRGRHSTNGYSFLPRNIWGRIPPVRFAGIVCC